MRFGNHAVRYAMLAIALAMLVGVGMLSLRTMSELAETERWIEHTHEVIENVSDSYGQLLEAETACRRYLLTGKEQHRTSCAGLVAGLPTKLRNLRDLTADNPSQQLRLNALEPLFQKASSLLVASVESKGQGREVAPQQVLTDMALLSRLEIHEVFYQMKAEEERLLGARRARAQRVYRYTVAILLIGSCCALMLLLFAFFLLTHEARERQHAESKFRVLLETAPEAMVIVNDEGRITLVNAQTEKLFGYAREDLLSQPVEMLIPERFRNAPGGHRAGHFSPPRAREMGAGLDLYARRKDGTEFPVEISLSPLETEEGTLVSSVIHDITVRKRAQEVLSGQAAELARSNTELTALNKELEAFSYSVSHDLRAPLRSIDGFSRILVDEYGPRLDPLAQHYLQRVIDATQHMGHLVDDLLNLSRLGRKELARRLTPLDGLVQSVLEDLAQDTAGREIEWRISPLPSLDCDAALIKIVFFNLLANAVKFTRPRKQAVIEVGAQETDGHWVIFVRDNGVGFDPQYADKLFGIFQRLHREDEFEGTGIGLATVQRIIHRHGGRIWAESQVDQGATFFFVLAGPSEGANSKELTEVGGVAWS